MPAHSGHSCSLLLPSLPLLWGFKLVPDAFSSLMASLKNGTATWKQLMQEEQNLPEEKCMESVYKVWCGGGSVIYPPWFITSPHAAIVHIRALCYCQNTWNKMCSPNEDLRVEILSCSGSTWQEKKLLTQYLARADRHPASMWATL